MNNIFKTNNFSLQIISFGSFFDDDPGFRGKVYLVETATVRLNHVAMKECFDAHISNCRDCYETDQEWQDYRAMKEAKQKTFDNKVAAAVGFNPDAGSICVTQALSEVFTVVHIHHAV